MIPVETWSLFREFSNPNKFRVIHRLHDNPQTASDLADATGLSPSTVRSVLQSLKSSGFVDYDRNGQKHRYYLNFPMPSTIHELILIIVLITDPPPVKQTPVEEINVADEDLELLLSGLKDELTSEYLNAVKQLFVPKSPSNRIRDATEFETRVERLQSRLNRLDEKFEDDGT